VPRFPADLLSSAVRARSASALLMSLALTACGTRAPAPQAIPNASIASQPARAGADPSVEQTDTALAAAPPPPAPPASLPDVPPSDATSYADRADARALAERIALEHGLNPAWTAQALAGARYRAAVARLMMPPQAGTPKNWAAYRSRFVEPIRIRAGVAFWRQHEATLQRAETLYGVPAEIIAGVLGVETIYGRQTGQFRVLDVLATLSLDFPKGRSDRSAYFRSELGQFLKLCEEQGTAPETVLGSYAGAIGLPQFMPGSIRRYAVDFDGDGRIDLSRSPADAIGSVGHYLARHGWKPGWASHFDVKPPENQDALGKLLAPDIKPTFSAREMGELGAALPPEGQAHPGALAMVLLQNGRDAPTLVAGTDNFYAVTRYNQSSYYALAVIQLGQAVRLESQRGSR
jgi:membrane-bound lytic murein transglycosylase B